MTLVREDMDLPGRQAPLAEVRIELAGEGCLPLSPAYSFTPEPNRTVIGAKRLKPGHGIAPDGSWQLDLVPNSALVPAGTAYRITRTTSDGDVSVSCISVPVTGGPFEVSQLLVAAPASVADAALDQHIAETLEHDVHSTGISTLGLHDGRSRLSRAEAQFVNAGATHTLLEVGGSGVIRSIWMVIAFNANVYDSVLRVYVDGEATPAVDVDMSSLLLVRYGLNADIAVRHLQVADNGSGNPSFIFNLPIPFSNGCRVEFQASAAGLAVLYWQIAYDDGTPGPYRLRSRGAKNTAPITIAAAATSELLNLPAGSDGWLAHVGYVVDGVDGSWIERDWEVQIDGEVTPSWASTGTEDWFGGSFGFQGRENYGNGITLVANNDVGAPFQSAVAVDLVAWHGGIRFRDGCRVVLGTEVNVTGGQTFGYVILYYLRT